MYPGNKIVLLGTKHVGMYIGSPPWKVFWTGKEKYDFVVGCNMSFDLLYLYREGDHIKNGFQKQRLWDIQLAEYLLSGQQEKWCSLDKMSLKYGLLVKDSKVTEYFDKGLGAEYVPKELLAEYLKQDLTNTEAIAIKQMELVTERGMWDLVISQMEALHCITEMMFNGLCIDYEYMKKYAGEVATEYADCQIFLKDLVPEVNDVNSPLQWSKWLFGGTRKIKVKEPCGMYKNGKPKTKLVEKEETIIGMSDVPPKSEWASEKTGKTSADEKVLQYVHDNTKKEDLKKILGTLLKYRTLTKQLTTYIQGLGKHIITKEDGTQYIYGKLNQVATATGRLSSTSPNLQNISDNPIKKAFISSWSVFEGFSNGTLVEFDFSQIEIMVLAHVTKDKQLITDISSGLDIHTALYIDMYGKTPTEEERKWFKRLTFGLIYGAGAYTLAENAGCSQDTAKKFIKTFYNRYPRVQVWHGDMSLIADKEAIHELTDTTGLEVGRTFRHISETKREYVFREYKSTYRTDRDYTFSPTELKNYPIQGLATGDIVPMMLGILFRKLISKDGVKLINTVHDSVLLDVRNDVLDDTLKEVNDVLNNTHEYYRKTFGIPFALKLKAGCKKGINWYDMEAVTI
jgi:DNA polymerase I-like protein with 3'-5' exonuclease and polymerase domains